MIRTALTITTAALAASAALAQPVAPITLTNGTSGPFFAPEDDSTAASDGAWFVFTLDSAFAVDIDINRAEAAPDLFATLFAGDVTGFDASSFGLGLIDDYTSSVSDVGDVIGPLTVLAFEDDTENDDFGGPFGDPRFTENLGPGTYSLLVTSFSPDEGGIFTITANIPAPGSVSLLAVAGLAAVRRRR